MSTPYLCRRNPKQLFGCVGKSGKFQLGTVFLHPSFVGAVRLFGSAIVSDILTLCMNAVQLWNGSDHNHQFNLCPIRKSPVR